jgi:hypothetical protein
MCNGALRAIIEAVHGSSEKYRDGRTVPGRHFDRPLQRFIASGDDAQQMGTPANRKEGESPVFPDDGSEPKIPKFHRCGCHPPP